jgi:hypothetical protein
MKIKNNVAAIRELAKQSTSFRSILSQLGARDSGGNYRVLQRLIQENEIDVSHFLGFGSCKGKKFGPKRGLEEYLVKDGPNISSLNLKNRMLKEGLLEQKCYNCGLAKWLEGIIPLELEHVDGNTRNNLRENLTLLCPNCHALTPTYRGKNKK